MAVQGAGRGGFAVLAATMILAGCGRNETEAPAPAPPPAAAAPVEESATIRPVVITPEGVGPLRIGMTEVEARAALGADMTDDNAADAGACRELPLAGALRGVRVMLQGGRVTRLTITPDSPLQTENGLGVGAKEAQVRSAYGAAVQATPQKYVEPSAQYLVVYDTRTDRGLRFETDVLRTVTAIQAGTGEAINLVEGCS
ncbi:MAG TPA: hypothetical protein VGB49_03385 [Caulobacteraceae bacterium]|jgi:hypothetical protein